MVRTASMDCGRAGGEAAAHAVRALRLHAEDQAARAQELHRRRHPRAQPAPADGHDHRVQVRRLLHQLQAERGRAQRGGRPLERVHERAALLGLDLPHAVEGRVHVVHQLHLGPQLAAARHAVRVRGLRHHHLGRGAEDAGGVGHGHGVVARAHRGDAAGPRLGREPEHHGQGAARLEGARALEQLLLQEDLRGARPRRARAGRPASGARAW